MGRTFTTLALARRKTPHRIRHANRSAGSQRSVVRTLIRPVTRDEIPDSGQPNGARLRRNEQVEFGLVGQEEFESEQDGHRVSGRILVRKLGEQGKTPTQERWLLDRQPDIHPTQVAALAGPGRFNRDFSANTTELGSSVAVSRPEGPQQVSLGQCPRKTGAIPSLASPEGAPRAGPNPALSVGCTALSGLDRLAASVPGALPRAGMFRPLRGKSWWCSARSLGIPSSRARKVPGALPRAGMFRPLRGKSWWCSARSLGIPSSRARKVPGALPRAGMFRPLRGKSWWCSARSLGIPSSRARKVPGALPRAGMFRPLRGKSWWCSARSLF